MGCDGQDPILAATMEPDDNRHQGFVFRVFRVWMNPVIVCLDAPRNSAKAILKVLNSLGEFSCRLPHSFGLRCDCFEYDLRRGRIGSGHLAPSFRTSLMSPPRRYTRQAVTGWS